MPSDSKRLNLVLIGMRCTGKTSVGRIAAKRLGLEFVDTDEVVVERAGKTIREIFRTEGEAAFRAIETQVVAEVASRGGQVIATGGGVVLNPGNVKALRAGGTVVHLAASPEIIHERLAADRARDDQRPALTDASDALEEIRRVWAAREPLYANARDEAVTVEDMPVERVAGRVIEIYGSGDGTGDRGQGLGIGG